MQRAYPAGNMKVPVFEGWGVEFLGREFLGGTRENVRFVLRYPMFPRLGSRSNLMLYPRFCL